MSAKDVFYLECWFTGHVQGVGFRYATLQTAKEFAVQGQVENLADGRVHLVAEGEEKEVRAFLAEVQDRMESFIRDAEVRTGTRAATASGFTISG